MIPLIKFDAGEIILKENEIGEAAYIIVEGEVGIFKDWSGKKIRIGKLGSGETVGEMSMVDEKPISATVVASMPTTVQKIHRDEFLGALKTDPNLTIKILKNLFERLREANATIARLQTVEKKSQDTVDALPVRTEAIPEHRKDKPHSYIALEGITSSSQNSLPVSPFVIKTFPFLIGRENPDPLSNNDMMIPDSPPYQVSRHHVKIILQNGQIGICDRGSTLGSIVDGIHVGGSSNNPGPVFFQEKGSLLILGNQRSPYKYRVSVFTSV